MYPSDPERMTWVSELRFLVCTGKITALYEVVVRLPGGDVGFDKGKPVLGTGPHVPGVVLRALRLLTGARFAF